MIKITIHTPYITLGQFLKYAGIIESGALAKLFLAENRIIVNGEDENRRGKKLYNLDIVNILGKVYQILSVEEQC